MTASPAYISGPAAALRAFLRRVLDSRSRISTQFYLAIGSAVSLTIIASIVGVVSFGRVAEMQRQVTEDSVPALTSAFDLAQRAGGLVSAAPRLVSAVTPEDLLRVEEEILHEREAFERRLVDLEKRADRDEGMSRVAEHGRQLIDTITEIESGAWDIYTLGDASVSLREQLLALHHRLSGLLIPAIDDQLFYVVTGVRELGAEPDPRERHMSAPEFQSAQALADLHADAAIGVQTLETVFTVSDLSLLEPLRERLEALERGIRQRIASLEPGPLRRELEATFDELVDLGTGLGGVLDVRIRELEIRELQDERVQRNRTLAAALLSEAQVQVASARDSAREATQAADVAIGEGRSYLFGLSAISVLGAVLIGWLFIGQFLVPRLAWISGRMRRMAEGDLEEEVKLSGNDEVSEMADALETFRRNTIEMQRLHNVEEMAEELAGKNDLLERNQRELQEANEQISRSIEDLQRSQEQLVAHQKLAALGEVTAGVAHEIRNPLNFVKNFAESSDDLLEELFEEIEAAGALKEGDEQTTLIRDIGNDLTENMKTIRDNCLRADSIVQNMLAQGRGSEEVSLTDINALVDENTRLAYHAARGTDAEFNLSITQEFDPEVGEVEVIPQNLGRVFLNVVSNACYATNERRHALAGEPAGDGGPFMPELRITTRNLGDTIEIRFRDNGGGIPQDIVDKIFNPFFTTKPTDKGTGLGLAICTDIVRQHGGTMKVETEPGEGTEMIVVMPRTPPPNLGQPAEEDEDPSPAPEMDDETDDGADGDETSP